MSYIQTTIQKGIQTELQHRTSCWVSGSACSHINVEGSQLDEGHIPAGVATASIASMGHPSLAGEDVRDRDLSDDEDLAPDQPSFVGLFKPQLFRSLLHKVKLTTQLGTTQHSLPQGEGAGTLVPLFEEPVIETEEIPGPKI